MRTRESVRRGILPIAIELLVVAALIALVTWGCWRMQADSTSAALLYMLLIVLVSLRGHLVPALIVGLGALLALDYYFTPPLRAISLSEGRDLVALVVFGATAILVTRLVAAVRRGEDHWRNAFENNPTMYFMVDSKGTVLSVNPFGAEQLGYGVDELVGQPVVNVSFEDDKQTAADYLARCLANVGQSQTWELRKVRKDGEMLWVRETARAVRPTRGRPVVLVACEDITARREVEERLKESEARLRWQASLLDLTHDTIFVRDSNDVIVYWNRGAEERYGWSRAEAIGQVTHELLHTDFPEPLEQINGKLLQAGHWNGELGHTKRDGTRIVVASRWSLERDALGQPAGVLESNNDITERKRAEGELRRSQAYLAESQRLTHTGSWAIEHHTGETVYWSEETFRLYGRDPNDGLPSIEEGRRLVHPEDRERVFKLVTNAFHTKSEFAVDYRMLLPDGTIRDVHAIGHPVGDDDGEVVEYVGTTVDVTAHKQAEDERRTHLWFLESMNQINRAMQGANDIEEMMGNVLDVVLSIFDCDRVTLMHPADPNALAYTVAMARTRPEHPINLMASPISEDTARLFRLVLAAEKPVRLGAIADPSLPGSAMGPDGTTSGLVMALRPKIDAPYLLSVNQSSHARVWTDREERLFQEIGRRLEDALTTLLVLRDLRESAQRYRNIFQTAAVSIWEEDFSEVKAAIDGLRAQGVCDFGRYFAEHPEFVARAVGMVRVVDVNDATIAMFAAGSRERLLESLDQVFTAETLGVFEGELLAIAEGRTSFASEAMLRKMNGERVDVLLTIAFPPDPSTLDSVLVSIMDVTARKRAEEGLQRAQSELARAATLTTMGELAASIAHELRQPLAAIVMNGSAALRWLNRESPNLAEVSDAATRIVREAQRADGVIRGLRALLTKAEFTPLPLDLHDVIREVLELMRNELRRSEVAVHTDLADDLPPTLGDRVQLQQLLLNLILNAIEAMSRASTGPRAVFIRTEGIEQAGASVTIEDTGPGLDPVAAGRLFDAFFTTKPNGLGMGLAICRSVVEAHGGQLTVAPREPHGAAFRFTIPAAARSEPAPRGSEPRAYPSHAADAV